MKRLLSSLLWLALIGVSPSRLLAADTQQGFESPEPSWQLAEADGSTRLLDHKRDFTTAHGGQGSEHFRLWAGPATQVLLAHRVAPASIIKELQPSLWIKADRPGLRLMVRVVLPRSTDDHGNKLTVLVEGDTYTQVASWQQLRVRDLQRLLLAEVWRRRLQFPDVDEREAYIDHIVINAYGGPGETRLWIDDLSLAGHADSTRAAEQQAWDVSMPRQPTGGAMARTETTGSRATLQGSVLVAEGRPFFARAIEHNGEPMNWLKSLGFNAVMLRQPPTRAQLAEAREAKMWLVAPPPVHEGRLTITPEHDRVLAWRVGDDLTRGDAAAVSELVAHVRYHDGVRGRPILCHVREGFDAYSTTADMLLVGRSVLGTSFDLRNYDDWLEQTLPGAKGQPFWGVVQTEPSTILSSQLALARTTVPTLAADVQQIRLLAFANVACGARGVCFRSHSRLDGRDAAARLRSASLQLINAELQLVEPWSAGGSYVERLTGTPADLDVRVLETDRSRLMISSRHASEQQYVSTPPQSTAVSYALHGAPITDQAYHLGSDGLRSLRGSRAGGMRVSYEDASDVSLVLLTQDPLIINRVGQDLAALREQRVRLQHQIATLQLRQTEQVFHEGADRRYDSVLEEARFALARAEELLKTRDTKTALDETLRATHALSRARREYWERNAYAFPSPASSPLCSSFAALPLHVQAARDLAGGAWSDNLLSGGDCESLEVMLRGGWRQRSSATDPSAAYVELSPREPAAGRSSLRMAAGNALRGNEVAEDWPISITSAAVEVEAGQVVLIEGWVRVPNPITDSFDGVMIFDSIGGIELADRITRTEGWRRFSLYRVAQQRGSVSVTIALTGEGEAWVDDVVVSVQQ